MPEYQNAKKISVYLSMPSREISTKIIVDHAIQNGKKVFVPYMYKRIQKSSRKELPAVVMDMFSLHSMEDYESLRVDKWGIPSISAESAQGRESCLGDSVAMEVNSNDNVLKYSDLDIIIVPGVAFDRERRRLGHGKGFYDFFLSRYQSQRNQEQTQTSIVPVINQTPDPAKYEMPPLGKY